MPRALRSGSLLVGGLIVAGLLAVALAAPWLAPHAPTAIFPARRSRRRPALPARDGRGGPRHAEPRPPRHPRVDRRGDPVGGAGGAGGDPLGVGLGYRGGAPDLLAMRVFDVLFAFPPILLAIALVAALGPSAVNLVLTIAVLTLPSSRCSPGAPPSR